MQAAGHNKIFVSITARGDDGYLTAESLIEMEEGSSVPSSLHWLVNLIERLNFIHSRYLPTYVVTLVTFINLKYECGL